MLPPKVTVTIPHVRERRYVRPGEGAVAPAAPPASPPDPFAKPGSATTRQRVYVGRPAAEAPAPAAAPVPAPAPVANVVPVQPPPAWVPAISAAPVPAPATLPPEPVEIPVSAYSPDEARVLGTPRGLVPFAALEGLRATLPPTPPLAEVEALLAEGGEGDEPEPEPRPTLPATPGPDPMLDEVIEGLRTRIQQLKAARRGPASSPGEIAAPPTHATARLVRAPQPEPSFGRLLLSTFLVLFVAAGFGFGGHQLRLFMAGSAPASLPPRAEAPKTPTEAKAVPTWQETDLARLDSILSAERSRSKEEMGRLIGQLSAERPGLPGLEMLAARHSLLTRLSAETEVRLVRLIGEARPDERAQLVELHYLRARNFAAQRSLDNLRRARASLDEALKLDPRRADLHFERAELHRRLGSVAEALVDYERALTRTRAGWQPARARIEFRRRLLLVDADRAEEIGNDVYLAELGKPAPSGEWLLTAAAVSLHRGDLAAGAQWMLRARPAMRPDDYFAAIEDFFFRNLADKPPLKEVFPTAPERTAFLQRTLPFLADP
ncbi:MAG: hypothetical protein JSR82_16065 [Verrucomicrobia bacterium]|nr:hypothetical protein [Verrucomicrobiota bacterium]